MAYVGSLKDSLQLLLDWETVHGVTDAALAATWCRLQLRVGDHIVTAVEDSRTGDMRRAVSTSAYPLAEWIAEHWWALGQHVRPSAVPPRLWSWQHVQRQTWLRSHNLRAAGGGMPWPDLTIMPEGTTSRLLWTAGPSLAGQPLTFLTSGSEALDAKDVSEALERFVEQVLDRLDDAGVRDTVLHKEWRLLQECDDEEAAFAVAAARLGLDPFDVPEKVEAAIESIATATDDEALLREILDTADPVHLDDAARWLADATDYARRLPRPAVVSTSALVADPARPWKLGYAIAQAYRRQVAPDVMASFPVEAYVGMARLDERRGALPGLVSADESSVGLVLPSTSAITSTAQRFAQARALGLSLLSGRRLFVLDPASTELARASRAFAAECLAPAAGIAAHGKEEDLDFEEVAEVYKVSPKLVEHQYDNQLAA